MANCVSISAGAQHLQTQINANNDHPITKAVFVVKINIFTMGLNLPKLKNHPPKSHLGVMTDCLWFPILAPSNDRKVGLFF